MSDREHVTARLVLRPVTARDVDALHELWMHPDVRRFLWDDALLPRDETAAIVARSEASFAASGHGLWLARPASAPAPLVGFCGYWPFHDPPEVELLYGLARNAWGRGLATEMSRAMLAHGFDALGFNEIQASTDAPNEASIRVMQRLGMGFHRRVAERGRDTVYYRLRRADFAGAPDA